MPYQKKKPHPMTYYLITNKETGWYFCNKSTHPQASARHHFSRAKNPMRKDYNCQFYQDIRKYGEDGFTIEYSLELPSTVSRRAHYIAPSEVENDN